MHEKSLVWHASLIIVLAASLSMRIHAQAVYGSIFGTVTDPSGAAVVGATVTISDIEKGITFTVRTNESGNFTQTHLVVGKYRVKVEAPGFKAAVQEPVEVKVDAAARVDFVLQVGAITEEVSVTGEAPLLKSDRADVAVSFNERAVKELPIFNRNFTQFLLYTPGTQRLMWQHASSENPQESIQIMVNGQHFSGTAFQLDGTDNRDPILGIIVINPTLEGVTEAKITTQNYDAEFGMAIAGVVTAQTKSGTNELHGSAFLFRRNDLTQARDPFAQAIRDPITGKFIPDTLWNQFGGSLGGPIVKNKVFLFGDYQGTRRKNGVSRLLTVPTARARTGDLSEYRIPIFDPRTGDPATGRGRTQFPGNVIPSNRLSPQALNLLKLIPLPNVPGAGISNNFVASGIEAFDSDQFNIRGDHYWSQNLHLFGRYSYARFDKSAPGAFEPAGGANVGGIGLSPDGFAGKSDTTNQSLAAGFDYTVTTNTLTDVRFGWFRYHVTVAPNGIGTSPAKDAGIPGLNVDNFFTSGMPAFFIGGTGGFSFGYALGVNRCNCPLREEEQQFQIVNNWTFIRGNHNIKFGADLRYAQNLRVPSDAHRAGELSFSDGVTRGDVGGGLGLATFLLGEVTFFSRYVSPVTDAAERQKRFFWYAQDTWRVSPKLTFNYGLRWEQIFPQSVTGPAKGGFVDITTGEVLVYGVGPFDRSIEEMNWRHFAPRVGLTYQATSKTVVRLGYGRSFDIGVFGSVFGHSVTQNLPVLARQNVTPVQDFLGVFNLAQGPPAFTEFFGLTAPPNRGGRPNAALPSSGRFFLPDGANQFIHPTKLRLPTIDAWNVTVQHQLTPTLSLELAYVANKGTHVFTDNAPDYNLNQPRVRRPGEDPAVFTFAARRPFFAKFGWTQDLRYHANDSSNNWHSLQLKMEKRFSSGYQFLAHYTWSRGFNFDSDYYIHNARLNYGPMDFNREHVFVFSNVWELPFGKGRQFLTDVGRGLDLLVGGWQVNSVTTWTSGLPFSPSYRDCRADVDTGPCRPNRVGDPSVDNPSRFGWFRVGLGSGTPWARPAPLTFGNAARNSLHGPRFFNTDLSLFKNFLLTERWKLQFRAESFNIWNNVNLGQPDSCVDCNPATAGKIFGLASGASMRQWQFALRLEF